MNKSSKRFGVIATISVLLLNIVAFNVLEVNTTNDHEDVDIQLSRDEDIPIVG